MKRRQASSYDNGGPAAAGSAAAPDPVGSSPIVVGIGASAGGLEALQGFFNQMGGDTGAAFVVVQHLSPDFKSLMDEILRRHTGMRVVKVEDRVALAPDTVFLLPPRSNIVVDGGALAVQEQVVSDTVPRPIVAFFSSLARECGGAAIAIVMSGTGSDGARGVREVKDAGGTVLVQAPDSARFDGMPCAAIATGCTDFVLPPEELADRATALLGHPYLRAAARGFEDADAQPDRQPYEAILDTLKVRVDCDLTAYKPGTLVRRIERRMGLRHLHDPAHYLAVLQQDDEEIAQLARDCLINVTHFFRDQQAFLALRQSLQQRLLERRDRANVFRVWVAGCASGEEAYSIAVLLETLLDEGDIRRDYKIFATDIADKALAAAGRGVYPISIADEIPKAYLERLGVREGDSLRVASKLRNRIVFARHDVLRDPPFPRADLVTCRNLLIYFKPEAQRAVLERFHFSLQPGGLLFLGNSESVEPFANEFETVDAKSKIFLRRPGARLLPSFSGPHRPAGLGPEVIAAGAPAAPVERTAMTRACERLIRLFAVAGVVVDDAGHLVYSFGDVASWLSVPRGRVSTNLFDMLPGDAVSATRWGMRQARHTEAQVKIGSVSVDGKDCALELVHVPEADGLPGLDVILLATRSDEARTPALPADSEEVDLDDAVRRQIEALENDLQSTRERLQTTIEELETSNEELQSTNEELLASNEELQSTNEELHSVNEELFTVNAEHEQKIAELTEVTGDLEHLLHTTEIGTVFLDRDLRVRRFTPSARIALPLRDRDTDRSITELTTHLVDVDLGEVSRSVLRDGEPVEREVTTVDGQRIYLRVLPYMTGHGGASGAVITFVDVTRIEDAERGVRERAKILKSIEATSSDVFWAIDGETLRVQYLSPSFERIWGRTLSDRLTEPAPWLSALHPDDRERVEREYLAKIRDGAFESQYRIVRPDGGVRWISDRAHGVIDEDGRKVVVGSAEDVTTRVQLDGEHRRSLEVHRRACDHALVPMLLVGLDGEVVWSNAAASRALGDPDSRALGAVAELLPSESDRQLWSRCLSRAKSEGSSTAEVSLQLAEGLRACELDLVYVPDEEALNGNGVGFYVCQWLDRSEQAHRESELASKAASLEVQADRDALTGLLNRRGLERVLGRQSALDNRRGEATVVVLIDCDHFKKINDGLGHAAGDRTLQEVALRLRRSLRPSDVLARVGGDEFLVVLPGARLAEGLHVAEKLRRNVNGAPISYRGREIEATVSAGVVSVPGGLTSPEDLIAKAGASLTRSKQLGRDRVYGVDDAGRGCDEALENLLAGEVRIVEQTVHDVRTSSVVGRELFARGVEPLATPGRFFEAARHADRLEELDLVCLQRCTARADQLPGDGRIHVNVFPSTLLTEHRGEVQRILEHCKRPERLCLELSEQQLVGAPPELRSRADELRSAGVQIALDDVGFGRTALETLISVEPDVVKIDRTLIAEVDRDPGAQRVLERSVSLLRQSRAELVAEGVEREGQREVLERLGVPLAQGFLWSRPDDDGAENGNGSA